MSNDNKKEWDVFYRSQVLKHYGGTPPKCACCGEANKLFLSVDHVTPLKDAWSQTASGTWARKDTGNNLCRRLYKEHFPSGYQILCYNCNHAKGVNRECPHKLIPNFSFEEHQDLVGA